MRRESPIRKLIAVLAIVSVFAGTQGFVVSSHTCNSCGTHEEIISLFGSVAGSGHNCSDGGSQSCCNEAETPGGNVNSDGTKAATPESSDNSCCTAPKKSNGPARKSLIIADTQGSCCSTEAASCETINGIACCEYVTEKVDVEPYKQEKQERIIIPSIPATEASNIVAEPVTRPGTAVVTPCNKHGGTEIIRFICCYLI